MGTFDRVEFVGKHLEMHQKAKKLVIELEHVIANIPFNGVAAHHELEQAMTKLQECFMWIGKAIRSDQME